MKISLIKKWVLRVLVVIAVFSLFVFLFEDYFEVDPYGDSALYYSLCATFLTFYLWKDKILIK